MCKTTAARRTEQLKSFTCPAIYSFLFLLIAPVPSNARPMFDPVVVIISRIIAPPINHRSLVLVSNCYLPIPCLTSCQPFSFTGGNSLKIIPPVRNEAKIQCRSFDNFNRRSTIKLGHFNTTEIETIRSSFAW